MAQITVGMPAVRSPGNMSPPNEMMLPMRTTAARKPAITSLKISELPVIRGGHAQDNQLASMCEGGPASLGRAGAFRSFINRAQPITNQMGQCRRDEV
jgi:hypothetical protein